MTLISGMLLLFRGERCGSLSERAKAEPLREDRDFHIEPENRAGRGAHGDSQHPLQQGWNQGLRKFIASRHQFLCS
jgi:hypothetical protein